VNLPFFIAYRLNSGDDRKRKVSRPAIVIATTGVAIGIAVMIVSICVMLGFKHSIRNKVIGFGSHIQVTNFMDAQAGENYGVSMDDSMMNAIKAIRGVKHVQRYALTQGILKTEDDFLGIQLKGIGKEYDTSFLKENLIKGKLPKVEDAVSSNQILISKTIADKLRLQVGNKLYAYFISNKGVRIRRFLVSGIYETNLSQFDEVMCFTDLNTVQHLNGWNSDMASGAEVTVNNFDQLNQVADVMVYKINRTSDRYGNTYTTQTIKEANPQIFSWLDLLDMNVWIILILMTAVAGVTMISGLLIIILERTTMIGVLKALGARNSTIRHIFMWFAAFIVGKGLIIGNIIGFALCLIQQYTGIIKLDPKTYYVSTVPIEISLPLLIILNVATLLICMLILIGPSYLIAHIHPAKSMRYE